MPDPEQRPSEPRPPLPAHLLGRGGNSGRGEEQIETPTRQGMLASLENLRKEYDNEWVQLIAEIRSFASRMDDRQARLKRWLGI